MKITLRAVGTRMPSWVDAGIEEYARRMRRDLGFRIVPVALPRRTKGSHLVQLREREGEALLADIDRAEHVVALEVKGRVLSTEQLALRLQDIQSRGLNLSLLIGGPDGLAPACAARADEVWSLSALTLPHPLVRLLVTEQLYRAWSLSQGHPYHRG